MKKQNEKPETRTVVPNIQEQPPVPPKRAYVQAPVVVDPGIPCPHCGERYNQKVIYTYPNDMRRVRCSTCGLPFITVPVKGIKKEN